MEREVAGGHVYQDGKVVRPPNEAGGSSGVGERALHSETVNRAAAMEVAEKRGMWA